MQSDTNVIFTIWVKPLITKLLPRVPSTVADFAVLIGERHNHSCPCLRVCRAADSHSVVRLVEMKLIDAVEIEDNSRSYARIEAARPFDNTRVHLLHEQASVQICYARTC